MKRSILLMLSIWLVSLPPVFADLPPQTRWADPSQVNLYIEFPGQGYDASWELFRDKGGDLLVRSDLHVPEESVAGELILVKQRAVLTRGFGQYRDQAPASLDVAALMMQLTLQLLESAAPEGPASVKETLAVEVDEKVRNIALDSGEAVGGFRAPWSLGGVVEPVAGDKRKFDLTFSFTGGTPDAPQKGAMAIRGVADFSSQDFPVAPDAGLADWQLSWRDPNDPAAGLDTSGMTLKQLRQALQIP